MKIVIIGTGAIGCLFGAVFKKGGLDVALLGRSAEEVDAINEHGVIVERAGEEATHVPTFQDANAAGPADLVIIAVKAYDTSSTIPDIKQMLASNGVVLTLQNGIGNAEALAEKMGAERILYGTTAHGSNVVAPGRIVHAGQGETLLGEMGGHISSRAEKIAALFSSAGIDARAVDNASGCVWLKLIINAAINPFTAIHNLRNGALPGVPNICEEMAEAVAEAEAIATAAGVRVPCDDIMGKVRKVCVSTSDNISSMLQDVRAGRRTEIDYINGAIVRLGKKFGIPTPRNATLAEQVVALLPGSGGQAQ